jgi:hypothetical protein
MTKLTELRSRLAHLRRRRQLVRWGTAFAGLGLAVLWTLAAAFAIDVTLQMSKPQRLLTLLAAAGIVVWAARRFTLPWLGHRESDLDVALLVERQQKIDSDLVAALQFETAEARRWGSSQLEQAVVDYVSEFGRGWNVFEGFSLRPATRRAGLLAATVGTLAVAAVFAPQYMAAFLNRFLLGSAHYPTATVIERLLVNGREVPLSPGALVTLKSPYGEPLKFEVRAAGVIPAEGRADLRTMAANLETRVDLQPAGGDEPVFVGQLPKIIDSLYFQLYLGDAWTDPMNVLVVPLPVVELKLTPTAPAYARGADGETTEGSRQLSIVEGSRVDLRITCANKKLQKAWIRMEGKEYPLGKDGQQPGRAGKSVLPGEAWTLDVSGTPLARVEKAASLELQVTDEDDLQLEHPLMAFIRIKADQRPRISGEVVTKFVLPTANPAIEYRAMDDYGIGQLRVHVQATRGDGSAQDLPTLPIRELREPLLGDQLPASGTYRLELSPLKLVKGDQLKVVLEVVDYRGTAAGQSAFSEPLTLQVTDESGVLAAISESDERSARQLDAIITRQLGIGESK